jgi:hypothetical protein
MQSDFGMVGEAGQAQSISDLLENPRVGGSIPPPATIYFNYFQPILTFQYLLIVPVFTRALTAAHGQW